MNFAEKFRRDKKFRTNIILVFIAIVLMAGNVPGQEKKEAATEAQCNQANIEPAGDLTCDGWSYLSGTCMPITLTGKVEDEQLTLCDGFNCGIGRQVDSSGVETYDAYGCFTSVPVGLRVRSSEECSSKEIIPSPYKDGYDFICKSSDLPDPNQPNPNAICSSDLQDQIGSFLDGFDWANGQSCKSKFFIVAFGGGFLGFILLMTAL